MSYIDTAKTVEWETPDWLFKQLDDEFHFTLDPCATKKNAKVRHFYTEKQNGLFMEWDHQVVFMNPPYGSRIKEWVYKARSSAQFDKATVVCLLPSRTDTVWWNNWMRNAELRFVKGRLRFGDEKGKAPFPSVVAIFRPDLLIPEYDWSFKTIEVPRAR
jgi:site-specific DNA-methyltransferase (adenine-specific)